MAIGKSALMNSIRGSVGNMTYSSAWDNNVIIRSKPSNVYNPKTPGQTAQRTKFSAVVATFQQMSGIVQSYFKPLKASHSPYNSFVSVNVARLIEEDEPNFDTIPEEVQMARGSQAVLDVTGLPNLDADGGSPGAKYDFNWADNSGLHNATADDELVLVVWDYANRTVNVIATAAVRGDGTLSGQTAADLNSGTLLFGIFVDPATGEASNSVYIGEFI